MGGKWELYLFTTRHVEGGTQSVPRVSHRLTCSELSHSRQLQQSEWWHLWWRLIIHDWQLQQLVTQCDDIAVVLMVTSGHPQTPTMITNNCSEYSTMIYGLWITVSQHWTLNYAVVTWQYLQVWILWVFTSGMRAYLQCDSLPWAWGSGFSVTVYLGHEGLASVCLPRAWGSSFSVRVYLGHEGLASVYLLRAWGPSFSVRVYLGHEGLSSVWEFTLGMRV